MAGSLNKVMLIGNCGADPEIRRTQEGKPIATLRIATSEQWRDRNSGERKEKTEWHTVVIFNEGLCEVVEKYVKKGAKLYVEGALKTRKWQDKDGNDRYSTEIVLQGFGSTLTMLDKSNGSGYQPGGDSPDDYGSESTSQRSAGANARAPSSRPASNSPSFSRDMDDDIPF